MELDIEKMHTNRLEILHGGVIASMTDLGGSLAVASKGLYSTGVSTDINSKLGSYSLDLCRIFSCVIILLTKKMMTDSSKSNLQYLTCRLVVKSETRSQLYVFIRLYGRAIL